MSAVTDRRIVVLNTGSSSLKFAVYPATGEAAPLLSGEVEGIGESAKLKIGGRASHRMKHGVSRRSARRMEALAELPDGPLSGRDRRFRPSYRAWRSRT